MWGRSRAFEGAGAWESAFGGGLPVRGLLQRGEGGERGVQGGGRDGEEEKPIDVAILHARHTQ